MASVSDPNEQLLIITHEIRKVEHALAVARTRRKWSNLSLVFGPILLLLLYAMLWIPQVSERLTWAVYIPGIPIAIGFGIAAYLLKHDPGGPKTDRNSKRKSEGELELDLARRRDERKLIVAKADFPRRFGASPTKRMPTLISISFESRAIATAE